jgi:hypothetical protein
MVRPHTHGPSVPWQPLVLVAWLLAACSAAPAPATNRSVEPTLGASGVPLAGTPSTTAGGLAAATAILTGARLTDAASLGALEGIRFTTLGADAAAALLASGASGDALWAATYVYGSSGSDPAPLRAVATDAAATPTIRAMAGAGLLGRGDVAGFEPLITSLSAADEMDGGEPAGAVWEFAADVLERYTDKALGPTLAASADDRARIQASWRSWLEANRATLRFDPAAQLWVVA